MSEQLPQPVLQNILHRFSTDEFYLWTVNRDRPTDLYTFSFSYNESTRVVVRATAEELRSYDKPELAMHQALKWARDSGRLMGGLEAEFRLSELIASMPITRQPARQLFSSEGPTEAMLEASYRV